MEDYKKTLESKCNKINDKEIDFLDKHGVLIVIIFIMSLVPMLYYLLYGMVVT